MYTPFRELKVIRQHKAVQYTELFEHQGHNARSPVAHIDEVIHSAQATVPNESDQLRLERHQGHSARSPVAHTDEVIHSAQATLPNESDQLRLEHHQGHSARSPVAHIDNVTPRIPVRPDWRIRIGFRDARLRNGTFFFFFKT